MDSRLRNLRKSKNLSQIKVQMDTGIEQALLSKYENGVRVPPTETLIILADYYNVSVDYLLGRTDKMNVDK
ncbi:MAG: helix-turn-helix transcriptional regulator [Clostridia bacterium]|nr:helix-turn-helix transcriptional regulator [Clostridia bacterium]